jgi:predicted dienelactone hydrolase
VRAAALAVAVALAPAAGCGDDVVDPLSFAVDERGPYRTGYTELEISYQPPGQDEPRTVTMSVWYPTEDTEGYAPVYFDLFRDNDAFEDATPAPPIHEGGYPVHVYSHGFMGFGGTSYNMMGYFASHGWVAAAPSHAGNLLFEPDEIATALYYERSLDVSATIDVLSDVAALSDVALAGPVNIERVVMSGHSFGAFTTWASAGAAFDEDVVRGRCDAGNVPSGTCTEAEIQAMLAGVADDRIVAAIPMAGGDTGWFGPDGYDAVEVPVLLMTGTDDDVGAQALYDIADVDLTWIDVEGACHQTFALGGCANLESEEGFAIVNTYAMAFARRYLLDDDAPRTVAIVDGTEIVSPRVAMVRK